MQNGTSGEIIDLLKNNKGDVGFVNLPTDDSDINLSNTVMQLHDTFVASKDFKELGEGEIELSRLQDYPLLMLELSTATRQAIVSFAHSQGIHLHPEIELASLELMTELAKTGIGIACIPREFVKKELDEEQKAKDSEKNENALWSPINAYIGLSMLAEITDGDSRNEILDLFGVSDIETLRNQVSAVWESVYEDDGNEISTLANSLWLKDGLNYNQDTMNNLAYHYYASVYQADLGSNSANKSIGNWLNKNTGGLLKDSTDKIDLSPDTVLALYSTLFFQAKWGDEFDRSNNTQDIFHGVSGDTNVTYMNKKLFQMNYYWHDDYSAVALSLKNGSTMWFILPDEGKTTADVLSDGAYGEMISSGNGEEGWQNKKYMKVNLSVPKFDVSSSVNLKDGLNKMGVTKVFDIERSDFTAITSDTPVYVTAVTQSARVEIDEKGVKAAAYIEIPGSGAEMPPEEIIDFILDRPFVFVISKGNLPLFTGVVNNI